MPFEEVEFKSKAQAEKLREVFAARYGKEEGLKKWNQVRARSTRIEDLPERVESPSKLYAPKRADLSRKYGKRWRGA